MYTVLYYTVYIEHSAPYTVLCTALNVKNSVSVRLSVECKLRRSIKIISDKYIDRRYITHTTLLTALHTAY